MCCPSHFSKSMPVVIGWASGSLMNMSCNYFFFRYYYRVAMLVQYFFYKNVAAFTAQVYIIFFNDYSTQTLYDSLSLAMFNIAYTSIPIFVFGLLEQNIGSKRLLKEPHLYKKITRNKLLSIREFCIWFTEAVWHSLVTFFGFYFFWSVYCNVFSKDYLEEWSFGFSVYQSVVVVTNLRLCLQSRYWNGFFIGSIIFSFIAFLTLTFFVQGVRAVPFIANLFLDPNVSDFPGRPEHLPLSFDTYWVVFHVMASPGIWVATFAVVVASLIPDITFSVLRKTRLYPRERNYYRGSKGFGRSSHLNHGYEEIDGDSKSAFENGAYRKSTEDSFPVV